MSTDARTKTRAFTLIEVLIVIVVLSVLGLISISGLAESRAGGRDSARVADAKMVTVALGMYYGVCRQYPTNLNSGAANGCPSGTSFATFLPSVPLDPLGPPYDYATSGAGNNYDAFVIRATLEQDGVELTSDIDGSLYKNVSLDCDDSPNRYFCLGS